MIITRRQLVFSLLLVLALIVLSFGPAALSVFQRRLYGVKIGVSLEGQLVERLLKEELYDVVASLAEESYVEANNASWDWANNQVNSETAGQIVDVQGTISALLAAPSHSAVQLIKMVILPSITTTDFQPYYRGSTNEPRIALMVNVDWGGEFIPDMLKVFEHYGVSVTWFPTGRWAGLEPELMRTISQAGHELGNHGGWHGMASQMDRQETNRLIQEGEDKIMATSGQKPRLFAPPAGDFNKQTVAIAAELGYKTVLWTVDTVDWQRPAPTVIVDRVLGKISNGSLVLMHPTKPTLEALPVVLDGLIERGYQCVTVSELLSD